MSDLSKLLVRHAAVGFGLAAVFVAGLVWSDLGGFGSLILASEVAALALFMLTFFTGLTFASVQMGIAIMSVGRSGGGGRGGRQAVGLMSWLIEPARALVPAKRAP